MKYKNLDTEVIYNSYDEMQEEVCQKVNDIELLIDILNENYNDPSDIWDMLSKQTQTKLLNIAIKNYKVFIFNFRELEE